MAALTLFNLTYETARALDFILEGTATGGSATTIADTNDRTETDGFFNGGTTWLLRDAAGAGASPEGKYSVVSDFANTGGVITLRSTFTDAVAAGDKYAVCTNRWPLWVIISKVNDALRDMGPVLITDTTTITIADSQTEYSLPNVSNLDLREVYLQTILNDTDDNQWVKLYGWQIEFTATGTADKLILPFQYASGYKIKLVYTGFHPELHASTDKLSEMVDPTKVINLAVLKCLEWYRNKTQDSEQWLMDKISKFIQRVKEDEAQKRPNHPGRTPRIIKFGRSIAWDPGEPDRVTL
jgi:hypothetical protein